MSPQQIRQVATITGVNSDTVREYLEYDFDGSETPTVDELVGHIEYQESLVRMFRNCDTEQECAAAWCGKY